MSPTSLVITDGAAGNARQALALASAMGLSPQVFELRLSAPWRWLAPRLRLGAWQKLPEDLRAAADARPALVIGCGRAAALATALLRERAGSYAIQILDPRGARSRWDVIVTPRHDQARGDNVVETVGALNAIDTPALQQALRDFPGYATLPRPRTALLIGGSNRAQRIDRAYLSALLDALARSPACRTGSVMVSPSRRTDRTLLPMLEAFVAAQGGRLWRGPEDGANPYLGMLAAADRLVVTPDSTNLLSEAAATGKPVYTFCTRPLTPKLARLHAALEAGNHLRPLSRIGEEPWEATPLRELPGVASELWRRYRARGPARSP